MSRGTALSPAAEVLARFEATPSSRRLTGMAAARGSPVWLTGGFVRDTLLGLPAGRDLDLSVGGASRLAAEGWARLCGGTLVPLDPERGTWRVALRDGDHLWWWDFNALRGPGIEEDLSLRDFTVNALAVPLWPPGNLIVDPTRGLEDLASGTVRHTHPGAFADDPLRRLRALRFAAVLGFSLDPVTRAMLRGPDLVGKVAGERIRDEVVALLGAPGSAPLVRELAASGALSSLWPPTGPDTDRLALLEEFLAAVTPDDPLAPVLAAVAAHGIPRSTLLKMAALLLRPGAAAGGSVVEARALLVGLRTALGLGGRAAAFMENVLEAFAEAPAAGEPRSAEWPWIFLDTRGEGGLAGLALRAASRRGDTAARALARDMACFRAERYLPEAATPLPLSAADAGRLARLAPGPALGRLLRDLRMARRTGRVRDRGEAEAFVRMWGTRGR